MKSFKVASNNKIRVDTRPRFGTGAADAWTAAPTTLFNSMTVIPSSSNLGRAGTFSIQTGPGLYAWVAVVAQRTTNGLRFNDGFGFGGWNGAGLPGNNGGASPDPCISTVLYTDVYGVVWRLFRHDFVDSNPEESDWTIL